MSFNFLLPMCGGSDEFPSSREGVEIGTSKATCTDSKEKEFID